MGLCLGSCLSGGSPPRQDRSLPRTASVPRPASTSVHITTFSHSKNINTNSRSTSQGSRQRREQLPLALLMLSVGARSTSDSRPVLSRANLVCTRAARQSVAAPKAPHKEGSLCISCCPAGREGHVATVLPAGCTGTATARAAPCPAALQPLQRTGDNARQKRANGSVQREGTAVGRVCERRHPYGPQLVGCYWGKPSALGRCGLNEVARIAGKTEGLQHRVPGSEDGVGVERL